MHTGDRADEIRVGHVGERGEVALVAWIADFAAGADPVALSLLVGGHVACWKAAVLVYDRV